MSAISTYNHHLPKPYNAKKLPLWLNLGSWVVPKSAVTITNGNEENQILFLTDTESALANINTKNPYWIEGGRLLSSAPELQEALAMLVKSLPKHNMTKELANAYSVLAVSGHPEF